jgi:hypothetical protein
MNWIDFKKDKTFPKDNSWVLIQSSSKYTPKYEVGIYRTYEWYLPSYDDSCVEKEIIKWAYIEE